jgi:hypothetical protein
LFLAWDDLFAGLTTLGRAASAACGSSPGSLYWVKCDCVEFKKAVAATGPATVTVTTQVGKKTITGTMTINLE